MNLASTLRWFLPFLESLSLLAVDYSIVNIGPGSVTGINQSATVVGNVPQYAFYYRDGERTATRINASFPGQVTPPAYGLAGLTWSSISDSGLLVGSAHLTNLSNSNPPFPTNYRYPIVWNGAGNGLILEIANGRATAVNTSGIVVGSWSLGQTNGAFRFDGTTVQSLQPDGLDSAWDINDSGVIAGASQNKAAVWENGVVTVLNIDYSFGELDGSYATGINASGQVVGEIRFLLPTGGRYWGRGFLWSNGSTVLIGPAGEQDTHVLDVNNAGIAVGRMESAPDESRAYVFRNGQVIDLNTLIPNAGWVLTSATAINDAGEIIGTGSLNGFQSAFLLKPLTPGQPVPPSIEQQPLGGEFALGAAAVLSVTASGTGPLSYQWQRGVSDLSGETNATLTLTNLDGNDEAEYRVIVRNVVGEAFSLPVLVAVGNPVTTIARYAGLTIAGTVGGQYVIESAPEVAASEWTWAGQVTLTNSTQIWFDLTSGNNPFIRYYRVTPSRP